MSQIKGTTDPTTKTKASVGDTYLNTETGILFKCIMAYETNDGKSVSYNWVMINRQSVSEDEIEGITKNYIDGNTMTLHHAGAGNTDIDKLVKSGVYTFEVDNTSTVNGLDDFHPQSLVVYSDDHVDGGIFLPAKITQILVGWYGTNYTALHTYIRTCWRENSAEVNWYHWCEIPMLETTNYTSCMSYTHNIASSTALDNITDSGIYSFAGDYNYDAITFNPYNTTMIVLGDDSSVGNGNRMSYRVTQILISPDDSGSTNNHSIYMRYGHYTDIGGMLWTDWVDLTKPIVNKILLATAVFDLTGLASLVVTDEDGDTNLTVEDVCAIISNAENLVRENWVIVVNVTAKDNSSHGVLLKFSGEYADEHGAVVIAFSCVTTINSNVTYCELTIDCGNNTFNYSEKILTEK